MTNVTWPLWSGDISNPVRPPDAWDRTLERSLRCILSSRSTRRHERKIWIWRLPRHTPARTIFLLVSNTVCSRFFPGAVSRSANQMNIGSWTTPLEPGKQPSASTLNSNRHEARPSLEYSEDDIKHIEKWSKCQVL